MPQASQPWDAQNGDRLMQIARAQSSIETRRCCCGYPWGTIRRRWQFSIALATELAQPFDDAIRTEMQIFAKLIHGVSRVT